jgi:nucleotide-binding universal stress UspA family protein
MDIVAKSKKQKAKTARAISPQRILVPIDFSISSKRAFAQALSWARKASRITLLHVIPQTAESDRIISGLVASAKRSLITFTKNSRGDYDHSIHILVRTGAPFQEILAAAEENNIEMIVLGVNESGPLAGIELGHTIDRVSRYARCPVLLVRQSQ